MRVWPFSRKKRAARKGKPMFLPQEHKVRDVLIYMRRNPDHIKAIKKLERRSKKRKTILDF